MQLNTLLIKKENGVTTLTLNRPERLNAFSREMNNEFHDTVLALDKDTDTRVLIITGSGDRAFSAGADLKEPTTHESKTIQERLRYTDRYHFKAVDAFTKPIIAVVNGWAVGGGFHIVTSSDIAIASETARFKIPQVSLGLMPTHGGGAMLARLIGKSNAMKMILTCEVVSAQRAFAMGLVSEILPQDELMPRAKEIACQIASMPPMAVRLAKESVESGLSMPLREAAIADNYRYFSLLSTEERKRSHAEWRKEKKGRRG